MHARQYSKIQTADYLKGQFIIDVPDWDGTQPQVEDPNDPTKTIDDPAIGITDKEPVPGCYLHVFTPDTSTGVEDWSKGTWGEGLPQTELDAIQAQKESQQAQARLDEIDKESIRALRAINTGTATQKDHDKLASLEAEVAILRQKI